MAIRPRNANRAIVLSLVLLLTSGTAAAQAPAPARAPAERELSPDERARELYLRGDRLYAEGSYEEAIVALKEAYQLSHRPGLLYNIANALERLGRYEEALSYLNQYAPSAPEHQRHIVLKRIRSLELRAEEQRQEERGVAPPARRSAEAESAASTPAKTDTTPLLGYAIGGAGLVAIGIGTVLGVSASSARSDAEKQCVDNGSDVLCPVSVRDDLSSADGRALGADIAWGLGLAAVGVGVYLVLDAGGESGASTALRSTATLGGAGVSLVHTF